MPMVSEVGGSPERASLLAKIGFGYERAVRVVMPVCFAYCSSVLTMNQLHSMVVLGQLRLNLNEILIKS